MRAQAQERLAQLLLLYGHRDGETLLRTLYEREFSKGGLVLVSSFGAESAVLLHMAARIDRAFPVLFVNTGKLFGETLRYRALLAERLGLVGIRELTPDPAALTASDPAGDLWHRNPDACCALRKVTPLRRGLEGAQGWVTGRKRYQGAARAAIPSLELDDDGLIKVNPLAAWTQERILAYLDRHAVPRHPLVADGYPSIGCMPCTDRAETEGGGRGGRWRGQDKTECGIHLSRAPLVAQ
jgi:phosphoadenosine phosphosulfate reductase